jgi:hypothetical protein
MEAGRPATFSPVLGHEQQLRLMIVICEGVLEQQEKEHL